MVYVFTIFIKISSIGIHLRRFYDNGDGKTLPSCLYPMKYLNESLLCDFLSDNAILLISTSLILIGFLFLWKALLLIYFLWNLPLLAPFLYYKKKSQSFSL